MLPSKTIPEANNKKKQTRNLKPKPKFATATAPSKKKARARSVEIEEIDDKDSTHNIAARNNSTGVPLTSSFETSNIKKVSYVIHCI